MSRSNLSITFLTILLSLLVAGCGTMADPTGWFGDKVDKVEPSELVDIKEELQVKTLWKQSVGNGTDNKRLKLVPRIDAGKVYAADSEGLVMALDAETGRQLWSVNLELPLSGGPGSGEGIVFLGTSDGEIVALSDTTGEELWRSKVSSEVLSVPAAANGVVAVHTIDGKLFGLDVLTGKQLWLYSRQVPVLTLRGSGSPVISGNSVYCGFAGGKLVALELSSGALQWEVSITIPSGRSELERMVDIDGDPLISDGVIYVATYQGEVAAIGEYTGNLLWRRKLSSYSAVSADWRNLYVSDDVGEVWGINPENGAAMWKQKKLTNRRLSPPAVIGGYVVVGDYDGYLHWLSHADGHLVARTRVGDEAINAAPVVVNDVVYVLGDGGDLAAVRPEL